MGLAWGAGGWRGGQHGVQTLQRLKRRTPQPGCRVESCLYRLPGASVPAHSSVSPVHTGIIKGFLGGLNDLHT